MRVRLDGLHQRRVRPPADARPAARACRAAPGAGFLVESRGRALRDRPVAASGRRRAAQRLRLRAARRPRRPGQPPARPGPERRRRRDEGDHGVAGAVAGRRRARVGDLRHLRGRVAGAVRRRFVGHPARGPRRRHRDDARPRASCSPRRVRGRSTPSRWRCCATPRSTGGRCASSRPTASGWPGCSPDRSAHWPEATLAQVRGEYCAELETDARPGARGRPRRRADLRGLLGRASRARSAPSPSLPAGGAYVLSGGWADSDDGSPYLVDSNGVTYPLVGPDAADNLGFAGFAAPVVPDSWVKLFDRGRQPVGRRRPVPPGATQRQAVRVARRLAPAAVLAAYRSCCRAPVRRTPRRSRALDSVLCDDVGEEVVATTDPSAPLDRLRIAEAQELVGGPARAGAGVNVAVLDSGVSRQGGGVRVVGGTVVRPRRRDPGPARHRGGVADRRPAARRRQPGRASRPPPASSTSGSTTPSTRSPSTARC